MPWPHTGTPRATGDIDLWVRPEEKNGRRVIRALAKFVATVSAISVEHLLKKETIIQIAAAPCRIDIITAIDGVGFAEAWGEKVAVEVDGLVLNILSKSHLLKNKLAANRDKDQSDIAWLKKNQESA